MILHRIVVPSIVLLLLLIGANGCVHKIEENIDLSPTATPYTIDIPPFFPPMDIPADNPMTFEGIELGRFLFWEKKLSLDNSISCGSCHLPSASFSDPEQFSTGVTGEQGNRQSMALVNIGWARDYFWDGRAVTIEEQIHEPIPNPIEMNQPWEDALEKLSLTDVYPPMFEEAFGTPVVTELRARKAMAQFLR
ncbi:MAG: cytochrome c peroxidase, partial [Flavobacteriales bacterium]